MGRIQIFTGKGGVGKTSAAAAHALHSAMEGQKTLLVSTDMAHNLSDIFEIPLGKKEQEVLKDLFVLELDPNYIMEKDFADIKRSFTNMFSSLSIPADNMDQLSVLPGIDELFCLLKIMEIYEQKIYDRIIVDCAPTGETLSLLKFPELLSWYMEKFFPIEKIALRVLSPISKKLFKIELPDKKAMSDIELIYYKMIRLQELLKDRDITSIRLVAIPEKMVLEETKRNYMYMNLYNFQVDGLCINRILPKDIHNSFFQEWMELQDKYIEELESVFSGLSIYRIPWFDIDINGIKGISRIQQEVLQGHPIFELPKNNYGEQYEKTAKGYMMKLYLPCSKKEDLNLHESDSDIILKIGNFKRVIPKPDILRNYEIVGAKQDNSLLHIVFEDNKKP